MDFLYRMHLVDFDPMDKVEIQKHWIWIKQAIQLSSDSLFQEVEKKEFDSLCNSTQAKIHKYLLRGRFRSTPFGLWAGVGLGVWGDSNQIHFPLLYSKIEEKTSEKTSEQTQITFKYRLAPGLKVYSEQVQFWSYCIREEGWRISYLDKNPLIVTLLAYFEKSANLDFYNYQKFFKSTNKHQISALWEMLLESGILIPEDFPAMELPSQSEGMDIRIQSKIILNRHIHEKLEMLISEIGNLFVPVESDYLRNFKSWLIHAYDDRFVPLTLLDHQQDFSSYVENNTGEMQRGKYYSKDIQPFLWKNTEEFDLSSCFDHKKTELHHVQIAFKLMGETDLYIENIVCNRPFAYSGRFSLDPEIKSWVTDNIEDIHSTALHADIILFETSKSNHISRHSNAFQYSIYPFGKGIKKDHLGVDDLLVGIKDNRLILYSQELSKEIIPVVQHPLNPDQISHTLSRLIWEIGNQDQQRFLPYHDASFQHSSYTPRLTWKGIILQGRKWLLYSKSYADKSELLKFLEDSEIPCPLVAGHLDRELLLNWRSSPELVFMWDELNRLEEITVFECPWMARSPLKTKNHQLLYPQVIYSWKGKSRISPKIDFLNRISGHDGRWTYLRIGIKEDGLLPLLLKPLPGILRSMKTKFLLRKWYFLCYNSPKSEIRLRVLADGDDQKQAMSAELAKALMESGWVETVDFSPYYPELEKYAILGESIGVSESIFHLESELILLGNEKWRVKPILSWNVAMRQNWIIDAYYSLIEMTGRKELFLNYYKRLIKDIPVNDRKELNNNEKFSTVGSSGIIAWLFNSEFSKIACKSEEELMRLIPNHLHMCCNRTFPDDTSKHERYVLYGLYKKLGKSIYGRLNSL